MCFLGLCSLFCLLLFVSAIIHSRGTLILFSVCGLYAISVLYITLAIAIAVFCTGMKCVIFKQNVLFTFQFSCML